MKKTMLAVHVRECDKIFIPYLCKKEVKNFVEDFGHLLTRCPKCNANKWRTPLQRDYYAPQGFLKGQTATLDGRKIITNPKVYRKALLEKELAKEEKIDNDTMNVQQGKGNKGDLNVSEMEYR